MRYGPRYIPVIYWDTRFNKREYEEIMAGIEHPMHYATIYNETIFPHESQHLREMIF